MHHGRCWLGGCCNGGDQRRLIEIGTGRTAGEERRTVRIAGKPHKSQAALSEVVSAVWLTPQMDRIFVDSPSGRRRFLDRLVFGFDTAHSGRVSAYESAMRQRAKLLRDGVGDDVWLGVLESTMVESAGLRSPRRGAKSPTG